MLVASMSQATSAKSAPVIASTMGYRAEMGSPHDAQRPRSTSHPSTGTLCHGLIAESHDGQRLSRTSDAARGHAHGDDVEERPDEQAEHAGDDDDEWDQWRHGTSLCETSVPSVLDPVPLGVLPSVGAVCPGRRIGSP